MNSHKMIKKPFLNLTINAEDQAFLANRYANQLNNLLNEIFIDIQYLTDVLKFEIPYLESIADKLPEKKPALIVTVQSLTERINRVNRNNEISKKEIKSLYDELKLKLESYQNNPEIKKAVREAMKDENWSGLKKYWCTLPVMVDFINELAAEYALELCTYLVNQVNVVINNLNVIKDIIDQLQDNISIIIKLRLKQIEANWSEITENVTLFKQQPQYWEGC